MTEQNDSVSRNSHQARILLVDDDPNVLEALEDLFVDDYQVLTSTSGAEAIEVVSKNDDIATVVMDIRMAHMDGIVAARRIRELAPALPVIFHTGYPGDYDQKDIEEKEHPFDYVSKGELLIRLTRSVFNAVETFHLKTGRGLPASGQAPTYGLVGGSRAIREVRRMIGLVAVNGQKVMILGETGTGKELVARAIHQYSSRASGHLGILNCNHKSPDLIESELFGHLKGAFTGAHADRMGLFEYADGGTVFLDEIGDLDITTQAKLLRVLETGEFQQIGAPEMKRADVRVICATHRNLDSLVAQERFRDDLYYRLKGAIISIPPLRERREDIPVLVRFFADRILARESSSPRVLDESAIAALIEYDWPGNVRQLEDMVESLLLLSPSDIITGQDVEESLKSEGETNPITSSGLRHQLLEHERTIIVQALTQTGGNISRAAELLQIDRASLSRKVKAHGIGPVE